MFSGQKWWTLSRGAEGVSIGVMEEEFRAESIYMHSTTHLGIRHHGSELLRKAPAGIWSGFEPWLAAGQSRLGWRNLGAYGFLVLGGGREQLGQWAWELCCAGLNVTSMSPNMAGG